MLFTVKVESGAHRYCTPPLALKLTEPPGQIHKSVPASALGKFQTLMFTVSELKQKLASIPVTI